MLLSFLLQGCLFIDDAEHAARVAQAVALFDTADTADTGQNGDTGDTAETGGDTAPSDLGAGSYAGTFSIAVSGVLGTDACIGTASLSLDEAASPEVQGEALCNYSGTYAVHGEQSGTFEGSFEGAAASGVLEFGAGILIADTWSAALTEGTPWQLNGSFEGSTTCSGTSCDYEGNFVLSRSE